MKLSLAKPGHIDLSEAALELKLQLDMLPDYDFEKVSAWEVSEVFQLLANEWRNYAQQVENRKR